VTHARVLAAFPRRPIALARSRKPILHALTFLVFCLAFGGLGVALVGWYAPAILDDLAIGRGAVPAPGSSGSWRCSDYEEFVACTVEARIGDGAAGTAGAAGMSDQVRSIPMLLFGRPAPGEPVTVLRDPTSPERITTSFGQSRLANRVITLALSAVFLLLVAAACLHAITVVRRVQRTRRALAAAPQPTVATLVHVLRVDSRFRRAAVWTFTWSAGATPRRARETLDAPATEPLMLDAAAGRALALTDAGGRAMLLTAELTNLQLTDGERQAVLDAIQTDLARPAPPASAVLSR
jgi:hypothetical protein